MLYVLDHKDKTVTAIDPKPVPKWCQDMPYKAHVRHIIQWSPKYASAMQVHIPSWYADIFTWPYTRKDGIETEKEG